jgi:predicted metal-dependent hydrolase
MNMTQNSVSLVVAGIELELIRKRIKNMHLRIYPPDGAVRVSAPLRMSQTAVTGFVESKASWIRKQQARIQARPIQPEMRFVSGELHDFLGESYVLHLEETDGRSAVAFGPDQSLHIKTRGPLKVEGIARLLRSAYRRELQARIDVLIPMWEQRMGVKTKRIRIRLMKRKWGACRPHSGDIVFNLELIKYPEIAIEYVVLHELAHLIEPSHNARFKSILSHNMPDWKEVEGILNHRSQSDEQSRV